MQVRHSKFLWWSVEWDWSLTVNMWYVHPIPSATTMCLLTIFIGGHPRCLYTECLLISVQMNNLLLLVERQMRHRCVMEFKTYYSHSLIDLFCSDKRKSEVYNGCYCYQIVKYPNYSTLTLLDSYIFKKKYRTKKTSFKSWVTCHIKIYQILRMAKTIMNCLTELSLKSH